VAEVVDAQPGIDAGGVERRCPHVATKVRSTQPPALWRRTHETVRISAVEMLAEAFGELRRHHDGSGSV